MLAAPRSGSGWVGKRLPREILAEGVGAQVVAVVRDDLALVPDASTILQAEDILMLVLDPRGWGKLEKELERVHRLDS